MPKGATRLSHVFEPEPFTAHSQQTTEEKSRIIQSGIAVRDSFMDNLLEGDGLTFEIPFIEDLDSSDSTGAERVATDSSRPFDQADTAVSAAGTGSNTASASSPARDPDPQHVTSGTEKAIRLNRNQSWSETALIQQLSSMDPLGAVTARVGGYWTRRLQRAVIATMNGIFANNRDVALDTEANQSGDEERDDLTVDLAYTAASHGTTAVAFAEATRFSSEAYLRTKLLLGDSMQDLGSLLVHSVVYNRMQNQNLIDFIPDARGEVQIPTYQGDRVIIDDAMPVSDSGKVYESWLFGPGALRIGMGTPPNASEMDREAGAGNGMGQDILYNRVEWLIHPSGYEYVGTAPKGGPDNTLLATSGSWNRVFKERKMMKFARLITREAA